MGTPHNTAKNGDIAKTVLMPGDPLRAKFIAETFLENPVCFNNVRGMLGYTGTYKGKKVSVMGSGMGMPSIGIYSYELFKFYDVENIIRIGSCGSYNDKLDLFDIILATKAYSESTFAQSMCGYKDNFINPSEKLNSQIENAAKELKLDIHKCIIHSHDVFYSNRNQEDEIKFQEKIKKLNLDVVEMESFALFTNAMVLNKNAACLLTVSDIVGNNKKQATTEERQTAFTKMMSIALNSI